MYECCVGTYIVYAAVPGPPPHMRKPASAPELNHKQHLGEQQQQQGAIVYSEQDIERIINTATSLDDDSELEQSGNEHSGQQKKTRKKGRGADRKKAGGGTAKAVSYTHLTLPTICSV